MSAQTHASDVLEIRARQTTLATVRLLSPHPDAVRTAMETRVAAAPGMLDRVPVALDLTACTGVDGPGFEALVEAVEAAGPRPVAWIGPPGFDGEARRLGLQRLASEDAEPRPPAGASGEDAVERAPGGEPAGAPAGAVRVVETPVRSGQQIYARGGHLLLLGSVGAGAEVLADGHIHVYGALRGRALAGVQGDVSARIATTALEAELVSVAGQYQISEHIDPSLRGSAAQVCIDDGDQLKILAI